MKYITILFLLITQLGFSQSNSLSKVINEIEFQSDTIQSVYNWVTANIKYDVAKLKKIQKGVSFYKKGKYKSRAAYKAAMLDKVIKKKKGVCDDYTLLFNAILKELGYTSQIIEGLTKGKKGKVNKSGSHSWNAVKVDDKWTLYDPTWGAGYVTDKGRFVKKYSDQWYDVDSEKMKERHLPFDPIWQFSDNPMTYDQFVNGNQPDNNENSFDFVEMIKTHLTKTDKEKLVAELERSQQNGGNIPPLKKRRKYLQKTIDYHDVSSNSDVIKATLAKSNSYSELFGEYMKEGKSKKFKGKKWTLEYSKNTLLEIQKHAQESIITFQSLEMKDSKSKRSIKKFISQSERLLGYVNKELKYLESK